MPDIFLPFLKKGSGGTFKFTLVIFLSELIMEALFELYAFITYHQELNPIWGSGIGILVTICSRHLVQTFIDETKILS